MLLAKQSSGPPLAARLNGASDIGNGGPAPPYLPYRAQPSCRRPATQRHPGAGYRQQDAVDSKSCRGAHLRVCGSGDVLTSCKLVLDPRRARRGARGADFCASARRRAAPLLALTPIRVSDVRRLGDGLGYAHKQPECRSFMGVPGSVAPRRGRRPGGNVFGHPSPRSPHRRGGMLAGIVHMPREGGREGVGGRGRAWGLWIMARLASMLG